MSHAGDGCLFGVTARVELALDVVVRRVRRARRRRRRRWRRRGGRLRTRLKPGFPDVTRSVASYVAAVTARMFSSLSLASAPP